MSFCSACGDPCKGKRVNCGPVTREDVAAYRDSYSFDDYSACCEAEIVGERPSWRELEVLAPHVESPTVRAAMERASKRLLELEA